MATTTITAVVAMPKLAIFKINAVFNLHTLYYIRWHHYFVLFSPISSLSVILISFTHCNQYRTKKKDTKTTVREVEFQSRNEWYSRPDGKASGLMAVQDIVEQHSLGAKRSESGLKAPLGLDAGLRSVDCNRKANASGSTEIQDVTRDNQVL